MRKLNLLSNSRIVVFINDGDSIEIRPDQIPAVIFDAIVNAAAGDTVLSLSLFLNDSYDNYARFIIVTWDGLVAMKRLGKLFGDGSYEFEAYNDKGSKCLRIL